MTAVLETRELTRTFGAVTAAAAILGESQPARQEDGEGEHGDAGPQERLHPGVIATAPLTNH